MPGPSVPPAKGVRPSAWLTCAGLIDSSDPIKRARQPVSSVRALAMASCSKIEREWRLPEAGMVTVHGPPGGLAHGPSSRN